MRQDKPSRTAYKVVLNIITLGAKPGMNNLLPVGIVEATEKLLVASGATGERTVRWAFPIGWSLYTKPSTGCCRVSSRPLPTERHSVSVRSERA